MVFKGDNALSDISRFAASGLATFAPFDFQRVAKMPDGTEATVAFSLAFVQSRDMPRVAFFVCENRAKSLLEASIPVACERRDRYRGRLSIISGSRARCCVRRQNVRRQSHSHCRRLQRGVWPCTRVACSDTASDGRAWRLHRPSRPRTRRHRAGRHAAAGAHKARRSLRHVH
jgi:hypothetical protein